ncbi:alpha-L-fucosidase [Joostella sp. CR20]|uniref:alpha-L-fucosidase n=1 Tax=Joostella sp. CR20 TaxID=2804312 RepID=UPI00313D2EC8
MKPLKIFILLLFIVLIAGFVSFNFFKDALDPQSSVSIVEDSSRKIPLTKNPISSYNPPKQNWKRLSPDYSLDSTELNSESEIEFNKRMQWWRDAKFGMFIHWGLYSGAEIHPWAMVGRYTEHSDTSQGITAKAYEQYLDLFTAENYNPQLWAQLAKTAGMKYVVLTTKHHEGFNLWDSKFSDFDVANTPKGKDVVAPLAEAVRAEGLKFGTYYSVMDWHHPEFGEPVERWGWFRGAFQYSFQFRGSDPEVTGRMPNPEIYRDYLMAQITELVDNYNPDIIWFDVDRDPGWSVKDGVIAHNYLRSISPNVIIDDRLTKTRMVKEDPLFMEGKRNGSDYQTFEQQAGRNKNLRYQDWEGCMTMNDSWHYDSEDTNWKSTKEIIEILTSTMSRGGNYLLNVSPNGKGELPPENISRLKEIGDWMKVNSASIYETEAGAYLFPEIAFDGAVSIKQNEKGTTTVFCYIYKWPDNDTLQIPTIPNELNVSDATLLGDDKSLKIEGNKVYIGQNPNQIVPVVALELNGVLKD